MPSQMDTLSNPGVAKALVKGLALVDFVADSEESVRLTDLVAATSIPRPTVIRLLDALCRLYVLRVDAAGHYALGSRVAAWGQRFLSGLNITPLAADLVERLVRISNETSFLGVLDGDRVLYLSAVHSPQPVRPSAQVGTRNPVYCTAIGKVLLAHAPVEQVRLLLSGELRAYTANTITDRQRLLQHLEEIRGRGYATDEAEHEEGVRCVAAPVRDHNGEVTAAVSVSAPAYRFSSEDLIRLVPDVIAAAAQLSSRLGFQAQPASHLPLPDIDKNIDNDHLEGIPV